jgi:tetratricopeptide (TPR) repeat protein
MRCVQVLSSLALRLCTYEAVRSHGVATSELYVQFDHQVARALRQANARAWVAVEILLAGEPFWERAQLTWERNLEAEFFRPLRLLLDDVSLAPLDENGSEGRRKANQHLQAALGSGLLTSGPLELTELLLVHEETETTSDDFLGFWRSLGRLMDHLEEQGYAELKPLFQLRCATGEPFLASLVAALFRHAVETDPDLFGVFGEACLENEPEGVLKDLRGLAVVLGKHRSRVDSLLAFLRTPELAMAPAPVVDTLGGANRLERGLSWSQRGDYEKAIGEFTAALQLDPASLLAFLHRADAYRLKGDYVQALADYSTALRQDPSNVQALLQRGQVHWIMGNIPEAIADFSAALQIDPKNAVAYHYRGKALVALGDYDSAIVNLSEALRLDPYYAWAYHESGEAHAGKGNYERAIADYSEAIRLNPLTTITYLRRGDAYTAQKEYDRAIADYGNALRLDPHNAAGYQSRGVAYREQGQYDLAAAEFTRALELDFTNGRLYFERGLLFQLQGNHARALNDFDAAITRDQEEAEVYYRRGLTHQALGKPKPALADFSQALRLDPEHAGAYHSRGFLYATRGENDLALPDFNEALRLDPSLTRAYLSRAKAFIALGQGEEALEDCDRALQQDPELAQAHVMRGTILAQKGEFAQAIEDFSRALRADPSSSQAFYLRGVAHLKMENFRQAILDLTEAIRLDPNHARAYAQRAGIRQAAGLPELALADLAHAARLDGQLLPAYCRQLGLVHTAMGLHECAVADYTLALALDPNNSSAQAGREQAWKAYQTQPRKKPATSKMVQQMGGKFPVLLDSAPDGSTPTNGVDTGQPTENEPPAKAPETGVIRTRSTSIHRVSQETAKEMPSLEPEDPVQEDGLTLEEAPEPSDVGQDEEGPEIEILDEDDEVVFDEDVPEENATKNHGPRTVAEHKDAEEASEEKPGPDEETRKAQEEAAHRQRLMEEFRKAEEERKKKLQGKAIPEKKKEKKKHGDDEDGEGVSLWKKGLIVAGSIFLVYLVGSTAWGFFDEMGRTSKPGTVPLGGKLVLANGDVPLAKIELTFNPKDPAGFTANAVTKEDGSFKVGTFGLDDGIVPGAYVVTLEPQRLARANFITKEYQAFKTSPLAFDIKSNPEPLTIKVK